MKVFIFILVLWLTPVWSAECQDFKFQEAHFTACTAKIPEDDIRLFLQDKTGKIQKEIEVVNEINAEMKFTHEIIFSSTKLINEHFSD